jgi:hypothetical protein
VFRSASRTRRFDRGDRRDRIHGPHSLKITDAPGLEHSYNPHFHYSGIDYQAGQVRNSFDLRVEPGAIVQFEWRDWSSTPYLTGPQFQIRDGRLLLGGQPRMDLPTGQLDSLRDRRHAGQPRETRWALRVTPEGTAAAGVHRPAQYQPRLQPRDLGRLHESGH